MIKETVREIEENNNGWIPCSVRIPTEQERWFGHDLTDIEPREFIVMVKGAYEPSNSKKDCLDKTGQPHQRKRVIT